MTHPISFVFLIIVFVQTLEASIIFPTKQKAEVILDDVKIVPILPQQYYKLREVRMRAKRQATASPASRPGETVLNAENNYNLGTEASRSFGIPNTAYRITNKTRSASSTARPVTTSRPTTVRPTTVKPTLPDTYSEDLAIIFDNKESNEATEGSEATGSSEVTESSEATGSNEATENDENKRGNNRRRPGYGGFGRRPGGHNRWNQRNRHGENFPFNF